MASQLDSLDAKVAILMLKAGLDYNSAIQTLAAEVVSVGNEGKAIKFKHVQRKVKNLTEHYMNVMTELIKEAEDDQQHTSQGN